VKLFRRRLSSARKNFGLSLTLVEKLLGPKFRISEPHRLHPRHEHNDGMPPRISRSSVPSAKVASKGRKPKKAAKRALDAFSIASHTNPERLKIRQSRLGDSDLTSHRNRKRNRDEDEDEGSEEEPSEAKRRKQPKMGRDDLSLDEGSDSEGHTWTMGRVDEEDDSEIDSDEAFGESDEERFEGWTFRGSSSNKGKKTAKAG
jgi:U3 small nucleolar RNA-associated protein 14